MSSAFSIRRVELEESPDWVFHILQQGDQLFIRQCDIFRDPGKGAYNKLRPYLSARFYKVTDGEDVIKKYGSVIKKHEFTPVEIKQIRAVSWKHKDEIKEKYTFQKSMPVYKLADMVEIVERLIKSYKKKPGKKDKDMPQFVLDFLRELKPGMPEKEKEKTLKRKREADVGDLAEISDFVFLKLLPNLHDKADACSCADISYNGQILLQNRECNGTHVKCEFSYKGATCTTSLSSGQLDTLLQSLYPFCIPGGLVEADYIADSGWFCREMGVFRAFLPTNQGVVYAHLAPVADPNRTVVVELKRLRPPQKRQECKDFRMSEEVFFTTKSVTCVHKGRIIALNPVGRRARLSVHGDVNRETMDYDKKWVNFTEIFKQ